MLKITNPRGEIATTDSGRVWVGTDTDNTSASLNELQDIESIFPQSAIPECDRRIIAVAKDCFFGHAPSVMPNNDDEKKHFMHIWNVCTKLKGDTDVHVFEHIFSSELGVFSANVFVGVRCGRATVITFTCTDALDVFKDKNASPFSIFSTPSEPFGNPRAYHAAMQMVILAAGAYFKSMPFGLPIMFFSDDCMTFSELDDRTASAALMIALRARTPWFKEYMARLPF